MSSLRRDYSDKIFKNIKGLDKCLGYSPSDKYFSGVGACVGKGAVLRISFGTFLFFAVHFVALIGERLLHVLHRLRTSNQIAHTSFSAS